MLKIIYTCGVSQVNSLISACKDSQETHGKEALVSNKAILLLAISSSSFKTTQELQGIEALDFSNSILDCKLARDDLNSSFSKSRLLHALLKASTCILRQLTSSFNFSFSAHKASQDLQGKEALKFNTLISDFKHAMEQSKHHF
jgi:hypothetical protein